MALAFGVVFRDACPFILRLLCGRRCLFCCAVWSYTESQAKTAAASSSATTNTGREHSLPLLSLTGPEHASPAELQLFSGPNSSGATPFRSPSRSSTMSRFALPLHSPLVTAAARACGSQSSVRKRVLVCPWQMTVCGG